MARRTESIFATATFRRPEFGPVFSASALSEDFTPSGGVAWQSHGGPTRGHPARSLPFTLEAPIPPDAGQLKRIYFLGVFAMYAEREAEPPGTLGASVQLVDGEERVQYRQDLLNGRHYSDARRLEREERVLGDGSSLETVGSAEVQEETLRVDLLTLDVPPDVEPVALRFKDLGSPASFVLFDVFFEFEKPSGCPFRAHGGGVALSELPGIVRVGDRVRFARALEQMEEGLRQAEDLDEARGQALTFLAVVTAATLEMGGSRELHRLQLEAARELDGRTTREQVAEAARVYVERVAAPVFREPESPSSQLVDRALSIVDRNFAKKLSDASVASQLGLSTSHFRFLFREATGQPFHRYLVAVRLEKAKELLLQEEVPVSEIARAVGFTGLSHFSRAFAQRFNVPPTGIRRSVE
jgi:AraC-like DNA-binding protein